MALTVQTARVSYRGEGALDVSRKTGTGLGLVFAPSWAILRPALAGLKEVAALHFEGKSQMAEALDEALWSRYEPAYLGEMRAAYKAQPEAFEALLERERVVFCCYCSAARARAGRCHRVLLAGVFEKLGAKNEGEIDG